MPSGGKREGAGWKKGAKRGINPSQQIAFMLRDQRSDLAQAVHEAKERGMNPSEELVRLGFEADDEKVRVLALATVARFINHLPQKEEKVVIQLPELNCAEDCVAALASIAAAAAEGLIPSRQMDSMTRVVNSALEAFNVLGVAEELEELKREVARLHGKERPPLGVAPVFQIGRTLEAAE